MSMTKNKSRCVYETVAEQEQITFVYGKGKRKSEIQQLYEELESCGERLMGYKECFEKMCIRDRPHITDPRNTSPVQIS